MHLLFAFILRHWELSLLFLLVLGCLGAFEYYIRVTGATGLTPQEAVLLMNREEAVVLDIRDVSGFLTGHIQGALNIPYATLIDPKSQISIEKQKDKPILISYALGQFHNKVSQVLKSQGLTRLYYLKGGIQSWQEAGLPLVKN